MSRHLKIAIDWDGTLVDQEQNWLPGSRDALDAMLRRGYKVTIHSSRANWQGGVEQISDKLGNLASHVAIEPKPEADLYIDNKGQRFDGEWSEILDDLRLKDRRGL